MLQFGLDSTESSPIFIHGVPYYICFSCLKNVRFSVSFFGGFSAFSSRFHSDKNITKSAVISRAFGERRQLDRISCVTYTVTFFCGRRTWHMPELFATKFGNGFDITNVSKENVSR